MKNSLSDILSEDDIGSARLPIEDASTLPSVAFTSDEFYELEIENIFKMNWIACLFSDELPNTGDVVPFEVCRMPFLAIRGCDNVVRVFHNICPYDGSLVALESQKNMESIVTPYHGWIYDLEGKLTAAPYWDGTKEGSIEKFGGREVNLVEVNCSTFLNTLFINLSENPESFDDYIEPVIRNMEEYDFQKCTPGIDCTGAVAINRECVSTNWKTHVENACVNVLHENFVHKLYSESPEVPRIKDDQVASFKSVTDRNFMALEYDRRDFEETYPHVEGPHLGREEEPVKENFGTLYPNLYLSASSQYMEVAFVLPNGPDRVEQKSMYLFHEDVAKPKELLEIRDLIGGAFNDAFREDARITESVQKARYSPVFQRKFYAPFWDSMHHHFTNLILNDLERKESEKEQNFD